MVDKTSQMFITGPDVVRSVTGEEVTLEELGGARTHNTRSGNAHYLAARRGRRHRLRAATCSSYLPSNNLSMPPGARTPTTDTELTDTDLALDTLIPDSPEPAVRHGHGGPGGAGRRRVPAGAGAVRAERHRRVRPGRRRSRSASWPTSRCTWPAPWTSTPSEKAARFVRTCDAFNIPVLTFVDVPGFLPGTDQEWNGIIRRGAKLIYAYAEATVPLITVITRKAYGGAYDVMGSKHLGADVNLAWPTAQIAVMGAPGAVNMLYRKEIGALAGEHGRGRAEVAALRGAAADRVRGHPGQPVHGRRARLRRPGDQAVRRPAAMITRRAAGAGRQAADPAAARSTGTSRCERRAVTRAAERSTAAIDAVALPSRDAGRGPTRTRPPALAVVLDRRCIDRADRGAEPARPRPRRSGATRRTGSAVPPAPAGTAGGRPGLPSMTAELPSCWPRRHRPGSRCCGPPGIDPVVAGVRRRRGRRRWPAGAALRRRTVVARAGRGEGGRGGRRATCSPTTDAGRRGDRLRLDAADRRRTAGQAGDAGAGPAPLDADGRPGRRAAHRPRRAPGGRRRGRGPPRRRPGRRSVRLGRPTAGRTRRLHRHRRTAAAWPAR